MTILADLYELAQRARVQALFSALVGALHGVFVLSAAIVAFAWVLAAAWLPRRPEAPPAKACRPEAGERVLAAEIATLDPEHEPAAVED